MQSFINLVISQAIDCSKNSDAVQKHGSILVCKNQVFKGYNHFTGCSHQNGITIHAEEHAISNFIMWCKVRRYPDSYIRRKLKKSVLFTVRVKDDRIKHSPPCGSCYKLIEKYEIKHVIYSDHDDTNKTSSIVIKKARDLPQTPLSSGYRCLERVRSRL